MLILAKLWPSSTDAAFFACGIKTGFCALAKQRGVYRGRKRALSDADVATVRSRVAAGEKKAQIARDLGIAKRSINTCAGKNDVPNEFLTDAQRRQYGRFEGEPNETQLTRVNGQLN